MRKVSKKPNTLRLHDNLSNSPLELFFDTPTSKQHASYSNGMTKRTRAAGVVTTIGQNRQKHGREILRGWREGDFGIENDDGSITIVSSDPKSSNYREDWKEWFCEHNADLIDVLAIHAFENTASQDDDAELGDDTDPN